MGKYALRRILQSMPLLFVISIILFVIMNTIGDPLSIVISMPRPPQGEELQQIRRRMGLDQPISSQYLYWLIGNDWTYIDADGDGDTDEEVYGQRKGILRGDLGISLVTRQQVQERIMDRLPNTLILMFAAYFVILPVSFGLGIFSALRRYTVTDMILTIVAFMFYSMPIFLSALGLIMIFSVALRKAGLPHLPIAGMGTPGTPRTFFTLLPYMVLPVLSLAFIYAAAYMRYVRASVLEVMNQDYVRTARAKGISERRILPVHVMKNAALPLVTIVGLDLPFLFGGAIVTESIFAWPGMGMLFLESLDRADYPVLMGILMLIAVLVVVSQLATDLLYSTLDPRVRLS